MNEWEIKRSEHHAPVGIDVLYQQNQESLLRWATDIGESVHLMSQAIFSRQGIDGVQSVRSLCHLAGPNGRERLNQACRRALDFKATRYKEVKRILLTDQEQGSAVVSTEGVKSSRFRFQRELDYWSGDDTAAAKEPSCG